LNKFVELFRVTDLQFELTAEILVIGFHVDSLQIDVLFVGNDVCNAVDDAHRVHAFDLQNGLERAAFRVPLNFNDAIWKSLFKLCSVRTVVSMDFYTAIRRYKTKNRITEDRVTTVGKRVVDAFQVSLDHKCLRRRSLNVESRFGCVRWLLLLIELFLERNVPLNYIICIEMTFCDLLVEIAYLFEIPSL